ncbi:hypothetical protein AFB00_30165 (plasmid) [Pseudonocardia sp. HH130630-07]|nr:hypothetical protein AFB00_30165 [Pseudonocardia sp. HH130630-07]
MVGQGVTRASNRVPALDVLRGIAIIGTLASNVWIFTASVGAEAGGTAPAWLGSVSAWLPNGKFIGLLTVMFGIGLEIQRQSALRGGRRWPGAYPVRAALLLVAGLLNFIFLVRFDVLRAYAVAGFLVAFLLLTSERVQWWLIGLFLGVHLGHVGYSGYQAYEQATTTERSTLPVDLRSGTWWSEVQASFSHIIESSFVPDQGFFTVMLMGLVTFLLGAKLYRIGIFAPGHHRLRYWLIGSGFLAALPLDYLLSRTEMFGPYVILFGRYGAATVVALGILALVAEFYVRRTVGRVGRALGLVGRMALSCYLLQNILGVIFMYTMAGSGPWPKIENVYGAYLVFAVISTILMGFCWLWLRMFTRGPFEIFWHAMFRTLTGGRRCRTARSPA